MMLENESPEPPMQDAANVEALAARQGLLDTLSAEICGKLQKAINLRASSGIETIWREDEEAYQGIDDANRHEEASCNSGAGTQKPDTSGAIATSKEKKNRSTVLLNITAHYVDAGAARLSDMLLPTDDRPWRIKPTPIPSVVSRLPDDAMIPTTQTGPNGQPLQMPKKQVVLEVQRAANEQAEAATTRIDDWLVECQWHSEVRLVLEDTARIGVGILKGPFPRKSRSTAVMSLGGGAKAIVTREEILPGSKRVNPWNFFPELGQFDDVQLNTHIFERDFAPMKKIKEFVGLPGYLPDQIELALKEGPSRRTEAGKLPNQQKAEEAQEPYEIWYFNGEVRADVLDGCGCGATLEDGGMKGEAGELLAETVPVTLTLINDRVVRVSMNPLDDGDLPYDVMVWQRRQDHWAGIGIARKARTPQRMIIAANRAMMDNAGNSSGPQWFFRQKMVEPMGQGWRIVPNGMWKVTDELGSRPVREALDFVEVPSRQVELLNIIEFGLRIAEEVTGLPQLLQGQQGQASDTLGGMQLLHNNASTTLRRLAKLFDDRITEPHIRRYYKWLLQYGEDDAEKGDATIDAVGSSTLVEREIYNQGIMQAGAMVGNPVFGIDPKKYAAEWFKAMRIDPVKLQYDPGAEPPPTEPPKEPQVQVAEIKSGDAQKRMAFDMAMDERNKQFEAWLAEMDRELEAMKLSGERNINLENLRARMAEAQAEANKAFELFNAEAMLKAQMGSGI